VSRWEGKSHSWAPCSDHRTPTMIGHRAEAAGCPRISAAAAYYHWTVLQIGAEPAGVAERCRQAGIALGEHPATAVRRLLNDAGTAVREVDADPIIETIADGMRLGAYLPTRTFELTVHTLDIAAAMRRDLTAAAEALNNALHLAAELALLKGDGQPLLLALTGHRPLTENYSVLRD
jgi:hypothetical protein